MLQLIMFANYDYKFLKPFVISSNILSLANLKSKLKTLLFLSLNFSPSEHIAELSILFVFFNFLFSFFFFFFCFFIIFFFFFFFFLIFFFYILFFLFFISFFFLYFFFLY